MPTYKLTCKSCGKVFDKFLISSDIATITCSACGSLEIKRVLSEASSLTKGATTIPKGALSGGSCKSGFS